MTVLVIKLINLTQPTAHLYFKKKKNGFLPPKMANFLIVCIILVLM